MGCRTPPGDARTAPSAAPPGSSVATPLASASSASPSSPPEIPYNFEPGCAGDIDAKRPPADQLEAMGRSCAPGLERLGAWAEPVALIADQARRLEIELPEHACIRVGIASEVEGVVLRMTMSDPQGRGMVGEVTSHPPTLVPSSGPVCTGAAGNFVVEVTSLGADAKVQVGLWRAVSPPAAASSE
jgi:hypothetical protein